MGRGQATATDHFTQVLGRRRGRALDRAFLDPSAPGAMGALTTLARRPPGELPDVLRDLARADHELVVGGLSPQAPGILEACALVAEGILSDGWRASSCAWAAQLPAPLLPEEVMEPLQDGLEEGIAESTAKMVRELGLEGLDPQGGWAGEAQRLRGHALGLMRRRHIQESAIHLSSDEEAGRDFAQALMGTEIDGGEVSIGPSWSLAEGYWREIIGALTPKGERMAPAGGGELARARKILAHWI
jgi:hypothetical protein